MGGANMTLIGQRRDGQQFPVEIALSPLETEEGQRYLASVRDISETHRARQALVRARYDAVVARIGQLALATTEDDSVIENLPEILADVLQVSTVAVVIMRGDEPVVRAAAGGMMGNGPDDSEWYSLTNGPVHRALADERPLVVDDGAVDAPPGWPAWAASGAIVPLLDREHSMGAVIALATQPRRFDHEALQLLQRWAICSPRWCNGAEPRSSWPCTAPGRDRSG
jgi:GAF domain-containing protein